MSTVRIVFALIMALTLQVMLGRLSVRAPLLVNPITIVVLYIAIHGSPTSAMIAGSIGGILQDSFSGQILGVSSVGKTLVGYVASVLNIKLVVRSVLFLAPLIFAASCVEMLCAVLLDRIIQIQPVVSGASILSIASGNALIGTVLIKVGERLSRAGKLK